MKDDDVVGKCGNFHDVHNGIVDPEPIHYSDLSPEFHAKFEAMEAVVEAAKSMVRVESQRNGHNLTSSEWMLFNIALAALDALEET